MTLPRLTNLGSERVPRRLGSHIKKLASQFPVVTVTGPRQSGKTTLCKALFPKHGYVSLEAPDVRRYAIEDPRGFLDQYGKGAIFDEIQRAPELPSYLQQIVDDDPAPGRFILTGSEHLTVTASTTQSLAGRAALVNLLPLDVTELREAPLKADQSGARTWLDVMWRGGYPALYDRRGALTAERPEAQLSNESVTSWLSNYVTHYLERDVRQLLAVGSLNQFSDFLQLTAGRAGKELDLAELGRAVGITQPTATAWIFVLEASFIVFRLRPWHVNMGKRLIKRPKLYFWDTGLMCHLLGLREPEQLRTHPLIGAIAENWAVSEFAKFWIHQGERPEIFYYRDQRKLEVDLLIERRNTWQAVEIKSSKTASRSLADNLFAFASLLGEMQKHGKLKEVTLKRTLLYGGDETQKREGLTILGWRDWPDGV